MPDYTFNIFRIADIGGTNGLEAAGTVTVRDDDGVRDTTLDDIEQAGASETNGDQEVVASSVSELAIGDTIRSRGIFRFTNIGTGETYDVTEVFSETAGNPNEQLFIFTSTAPDWIFDSTSRSFGLVNSDGTLPYSSIVCFGAGTSITMADGRDRRVEDLSPGDAVLTDSGVAHPVRWIGVCKVSPFALLAKPKLRPIRIRARALGCGLPTRDLIVSPQHRILSRSAIAARMFGVDEVLIPATKLTALEGIDVADDLNEVTYYHLMFDAHHVIFSNGAPTESLLPGPEALKAVSPEASEEIGLLFPEVIMGIGAFAPARVLPKPGHKVRTLVARHQKNRKPLLAAV